MTTMW